MSGRLDKNFHLYDWWSNSYTYGSGLDLVLGNEALEALERAKPRILAMI